jgi:hypothetical protein
MAISIPERPSQSTDSQESIRILVVRVTQLGSQSTGDFQNAV